MLRNEFPYRSPSVGFMMRIFHPNVDEMSGSVCLDVINQTWSPMFADPLNGEAAALLLRYPDAFHSRTRDCVRRY
eukprot:gene15295-32397_t